MQNTIFLQCPIYYRKLFLNIFPFFKKLRKCFLFLTLFERKKNFFFSPSLDERQYISLAHLFAGSTVKDNSQPEKADRFFRKHSQPNGSLQKMYNTSKRGGGFFGSLPN